MKASLWRTILKYTKAKGTLPLDERQMDTLKNLYMELAKSLLMGFMVFTLFYGYMDLRSGDLTINFLTLSMSLIGTIAYYYTLRFCYSNVIGFDSNYEAVLVPAFIFAPMMMTQTLIILIEHLLPDIGFSDVQIYIIFLFFLILAYLGANQVYKKGLLRQESEICKGELCYRSRKQYVNYAILLSIAVACLPLSYNQVAVFFMVLACLFLISTVIYYGFMNPQNVYMMNEQGITYHKALWNKRGGFVAFEDIENISQQDTFNLGYSKDKVKITCKDGNCIYLYPENAYQFCMEVKNNL